MGVIVGPNPSFPEEIWDVLQPEEDGYLCIAAMRVACIPFTVQADSYVSVATIHTAHGQDWTLRCWYSAVPYGMSLTFSNDILSSWAARRYKMFQTSLYSGNTPGTDPEVPVYGLKVPPGDYYLNIQNYYNGNTGCYVLFTDSANPTPQ